MKTIKLFLMFVVFLVVGFVVMSSALSALEAIAEGVQTVKFSPDEFPKPGETSFEVDGLIPGEEVELMIRRPNGEVVKHPSKANERGVFKGTITVEEELPDGKYQVHISGLRSGNLYYGTFIVVSEVPEITAPEPSTDTSQTTDGESEKTSEAQTLPLSPEEITRPGSTSFSTSGLEPDETVEVVITNPDGEQKRYESKADANGNFSDTINVEANDPLGRYVISITGLTSKNSWHGGFTVITAPVTPIDTSINERVIQLGKTIEDLQIQVNSLENQLKYSKDPMMINLINWIKLWWWIGFILGLLGFFVWLSFGWQLWRRRFWVFAFPRPWWFFTPLIWFVPWMVWGIINRLVWWQPWVWVWWIFPWAFWLPWWITVFKEKEIWLSQKIHKK